MVFVIEVEALTEQHDEKHAGTSVNSVKRSRFSCTHT
jgi:hypothetical protein